MSNENKSIVEFDFNLICEYFSSIERQGPGSNKATLKALGFIENLDEKSMIADLGSGTGAQTMVLAENTTGTITAIDLFPKFIDILNSNANRNSMQNRVNGIVGSMDNLPFQHEELDLIWSEGAIYNIGFKKGIDYWRQFLIKGGYLAVSEACWLTQDRPGEIFDFWNKAYPEIDTISAKVSQIYDAGYSLSALFTLPDNCWIDNFYIPQRVAQSEFLKRHPNNIVAAELVENERLEADLYSKYNEFYGYVFFIAKKI